MTTRQSQNSKLALIGDNESEPKNPGLVDHHQQDHNSLPTSSPQASATNLNDSPDPKPQNNIQHQIHFKKSTRRRASFASKSELKSSDENPLHLHQMPQFESAIQIEIDPKENVTSKGVASYISGVSSNSQKSYVFTDAEYWIQMYSRLSPYLEETVSFRSRVYLIYILMLPTLGVVLALFMLPKLVFSSKLYAVLFETGLIFFGYIAISFTGIFIERIAIINLVLKVVSFDGTVEDFYQTAHKVKRSKVLQITSLIFYFSIMVSELAITEIPIQTFVGKGTVSVTTLNLNEGDPDLEYNTLLTSMGMASNCLYCAGIDYENKLYVPLTKKLLSIDVNVIRKLNDESVFNIEHELVNEVIDRGFQDIILLTVDCHNSATTIDQIDDHKVIITPHSLDFGNNSAYLDLEIVSKLNFSGNLKVRRCTVVAEEYRGLAEIRYSLTDELRPVRSKVEHLLPTNSDNCIVKGPFCLNQALRPGLSYNLLQAIFGNTTLIVDQDYSLVNNMFPDPSLNLDDTQYASSLKKTIAAMLVVSVGHFVGEISNSEIWTDSKAVQIRMAPIIMYFALSICISTLLIAGFQIFLFQMKMKNQPDKLLKYLSSCVALKKEGLECIAEYIKEHSKKNPKSWHKQKLAFGEDKKTNESAKTILRFGLAQELSKFQNEREHSKMPHEKYISRDNTEKLSKNKKT